MFNGILGLYPLVGNSVPSGYDNQDVSSHSQLRDSRIIILFKHCYNLLDFNYFFLQLNMIFLWESEAVLTLFIFQHLARVWHIINKYLLNGLNIIWHNGWKLFCDIHVIQCCMKFSWCSFTEGSIFRYLLKALFTQTNTSPGVCTFCLFYLYLFVYFVRSSFYMNITLF